MTAPSQTSSPPVRGGDEETPAPATAGAGAPAITITAYGTPAGQGRISYGRHGRGYYTNDAQLKVWRAAVRDAAIRELGTHQHVPELGEKSKAGPCLVCGIRKKDHGLLAGALAAEFVVTLARLKSAPKTRIILPITRSSGDWDHHGRSIGDALTQASVMCDDSQIIDGRVRKLYAGHPEALDRPGAVIRIWRLPEAVTR